MASQNQQLPYAIIAKVIKHERPTFLCPVVAPRRCRSDCRGSPLETRAHRRDSCCCTGVSVTCRSGLDEAPMSPIRWIRFGGQEPKTNPESAESARHRTCSSGQCTYTSHEGETGNITLTPKDFGPNRALTGPYRNSRPARAVAQKW
jgi:hypothetical protein